MDEGLKIYKLAKDKETEGNHKEAIRLYEYLKAKKLFENGLDTKLIHLYNITKQFTKSLPLIVAQLNGIKDKKSMSYAKLMHQYAIAMYGLDQTHEADVLLLITFQIYEALGMCNTLQYAQALVTRGKRQYVQELYAKSIDTFNSAKKIVDEGKNNYVHFNVMIRVELSISYQKTGQFYFAENMLLEARMISKSHYTRGKTLLDLAKFYMNINKYNLALPCLYEAKRYNQNVDALIALAKKMIHYGEVKRLVDNSWVKHRRDMLECDCCRKRFAILNVSQDGIKYCDGEECVKNIQ